MTNKFEADILYDDNHVLAVVKPVGVLSQADAGGSSDMLTVLKAWLKEKYSKPGNVFLGLVHRLDRQVGGAMVFAKTSKAASRLSASIRNGVMQKEYLAVTQGIPKDQNGHLRHALLKNNKTNTVRVVSDDHSGAKMAELKYEVVQQQEGLALLKIQLLTGRPHQIRVQCAAIGCPVVGDKKYGATEASGEGLALWSHRITIPHPTRDELLTFDAATPDLDPWTRFKL